jgi:hypothetical protein
MVLTAYFALSPVTGLFCHRRQRDAKHHRQLDASVGASGPHDFAVRKSAPSSAAPLASIASRSNVRDDRDTPLCVGRDGERCRSDLGEKNTRIFLQEGLDTDLLICPVGHSDLNESFMLPGIKQRTRGCPFNQIGQTIDTLARLGSVTTVSSGTSTHSSSIRTR